MSTGADSKTMPVTREYADGHERIFGKKEAQPGRWVQDPSTGKLIHASEYVAPQTEEARVAPVMVDRFYENTAATTCDDFGKPLKVDIGSRQKHREFMRQRGLTTADDYTNTWKQAAKEREQFFKDGGDRKERRELIGRTAYELRSKNARRR